MSERFVPAPPPLFEGFRERRTVGQRKRSARRRADLARQRLLAAAARVARPVTRRLRDGG